MTLDLEHAGWAQEEFGCAMLADSRLLRRAVAIASQLASRPHPTLPQVFPNPDELRAAYDFCSNAEADVDDLLTARHEACARRGDGEGTLLVPLDGSSWRFTDRDKSNGTGPLGTRKQKARGLKVMTAYALRTDGTPLGLLAEEVWARPEQSSCLSNAARPLEDKESRWWTTLVRRATEVVATTCKQPPRLWFQADAEDDQVSALLQAHELRREHDFTLRVKADRRLAACVFPQQQTRKGENLEAKLFDALQDATLIGRGTVKVRRQGHVKRTAQVTIAVVSVTLRLREASSQRVVGDVPLTVVVVREAGHRGRGRDKPLQWILYTTYPVESLEDARLVVQNYALRWRIERHHYTTKSGVLELPDNQLRSFAARRKWIAMNTSVSAHLQHLLHRARTEPDVSALQVFEEEEVYATQCLLQGRRMKCPFASVAEATLKQVVESIARLGGYQGPKHSGGPPGIQTFGRGWEQVEAARVAIRAHLAQGNLQGARDEVEA